MATTLSLLCTGKQLQAPNQCCTSLAFSYTTSLMFFRSILLVDSTSNASQSQVELCSVLFQVTSHCSLSLSDLSYQVDSMLHCFCILSFKSTKIIGIARVVLFAVFIIPYSHPLVAVPKQSRRVVLRDPSGSNPWRT